MFERRAEEGFEYRISINDRRFQKEDEDEDEDEEKEYRTRFVRLVFGEPKAMQKT
jgi:hypothetical protein